jgi:glucose/mannose-6-phosphate isomerase
MSELDNLKKIKELDKEKMANFIKEFPNECLKAYQFTIKNFDPSSINKPIKNILICGMGGSAISGDIIKSILNPYLKIPLIINRDFNLPNYINEESLVILISYSGETLETISCAREALLKNANIIVITKNGELEKFALKNQLLIFKINYSAQPRAALAWLLMPILCILEKLNLIDLKKLEIEESLKILIQFNQSFYPEIPTEKNIAKYLAYFCFDHFPIIVSSENFSGAARRFKNQINENSKNFSSLEIIPESFHNTLESEIPWRLKDDIVILIFDSPLDNEKLTQAIRIWEKLLDREDIRWEAIPSFGNNLFLANLSYIVLGDWVSFYLAILNQVDPTKIEKINWFKKQL